MKKNKILYNFFSVFVVIIIVLTSTTAFGKDVYTNVSLYINGTLQKTTKGQEPFVDNQNRTQVPIRFVSEKLGLKVVWNEKKKTVSIGDSVVLTINSKDVKTPNGVVKMDTVPFIKGGTTFVPIRFVSEAMGYTVDYKFVSGMNCIFISGQGSVTNKDTEKDNKNKNDNKNDNNANQSAKGYEAESYDLSDFPDLANKHLLRTTSIGSNSNNTTVRTTGMSWEEERSYLNSFIKTTGWGYAQDGRLTIAPSTGIEGEEYGIVDSACAVYANNGSRELSINGWVLKNNHDPSYDGIVGMNIIIESLKFYSNSPSDGLQIYSYLNKCFNTYQDPPYEKEMVFGSTKVTFYDNVTFGLTVEFSAK